MLDASGLASVSIAPILSLVAGSALQHSGRCAAASPAHALEHPVSTSYSIRSLLRNSQLLSEALKPPFPELHLTVFSEPLLESRESCGSDWGLAPSRHTCSICIAPAPAVRNTHPIKTSCDHMVRRDGTNLHNPETHRKRLCAST